MGKDKKPLVTRAFLKQLTRGSLKVLGPVGALLDQVTYGTLDAEAAEKERAKLHAEFARLAEHLDDQDANFGTLFTMRLLLCDVRHRRPWCAGPGSCPGGAIRSCS